MNRLVMVSSPHPLNPRTLLSMDCAMGIPCGNNSGMNTIHAILEKWLKPMTASLPPLYIVGGAVRDHLLLRPVSDIDLICDYPERFAAALAKAHNAAMVPFLKKADTPCFRVVHRKNPDDHIDIAPIHGGGLIADLNRRDFSINAMAIRVLAQGVLGEVVDFLNGRQDLAAGIIRTTGPNALSEDPLRILRAVRFSSQLDFTICRQTETEMALAADGLKNIAGERIWAELDKILSRPVCGPHIRRLDALGVLTVIFPEIQAMKGCTQNDYHHLDVWEHSLAVLDGCEAILSSLKLLFGTAAESVTNHLAENGRGQVLKLAALLHDIGKPDSKAVDGETGKVIFYGHDGKGASLIETVGARLRMPGKKRAFLRGLVSHHMHVLFLSGGDVRKKTLLRWFRKLGEDMISSILLSLADIRAISGDASDPELRREHEAWVIRVVAEYYAELRPKLLAVPLINGRDVLALGVPGGPEIGRVLELVRDAQDENRISNREEALALAEKAISDVSGGFRGFLSIEP